MYPEMIRLAQERWNITLKHKTQHEWAGPCPWCGGEDRFLVWEEGNYWCRQCKRDGWVTKNNHQELSLAEENRLRIVRLEQEIKQNQKAVDKRLSALERMVRTKEHILFHELLRKNDEAREWWWQQGIFDEAIERWLLGYCPKCPTDREQRPSYTIPVFQNGKLVNIIHRLHGTNKDKYRPHIAGLGSRLFNADLLKRDISDIYIVEGAKKVIVLAQNYIDAVGICGKTNFKPWWAKSFKKFRKVYVCLDPDAVEDAIRIARMIGENARVVRLPYKPDDFFVHMNGTLQDFQAYVSLAKRVC